MSSSTSLLVTTRDKAALCACIALQAQKAPQAHFEDLLALPLGRATAPDIPKSASGAQRQR
eukprot:11248921-Alexandrium_andersonii.AAC.1